MKSSNSEDSPSFWNGVNELKSEVIVKTAEFGYDGKGQLKLPKAPDDEQLRNAWKTFHTGRVVIEECISLETEFSVLVARGKSGEVMSYDPVENIHRNHILDLSIIPARISESILSEAKQIALSIAEVFDYVGILAVEFFLSTDGRLLVNELAPRPHNSGHHTINACCCSQFENQARAITGMPLGSTKLLSPVLMMNLLGDLWPAENKEPNWKTFLEVPGCSLHIYGKREARAGRKMGHLTLLGESTEEIIQKINPLRAKHGLPLV